MFYIPGKQQIFFIDLMGCLNPSNHIKLKMKILSALELLEDEKLMATIFQDLTLTKHSKQLP